MIVVRGGAELVALGLNALVIILVTRAVGPAAFGLFAVAATIGQIALIATNAGLQTLGSQRVANLAAEDSSSSAVARIWTSVVVLRLGLALLVGAAIAAASAVLVSDALLRGFIFAVLIALPFAAFRSEWLLIARGQAQLVAFTRALGAVATAIVALSLIHGTSDAAYLPLIFITPIVTTGIAGPAVVLGGKRVRARSLALPRRSEAVEYLRAGRHYLVAEMSVFVYASSDRLFLYAFAGATIVGLYDAAYKLIQPFYAISSVVGDSMYRSLATSLGRVNFDRVFRRWVDLMSVATIPVGFVALAFAPWIIQVVYGPEFAGAADFLALLGFVITFGYMAGIMTIPFTAWNAPAPYGRAVLAGGIANIAMNILLIPSLGGIGAALATIGAKITVGAWGYATFMELTRYPILRDFAYYWLASAISVLLAIGAGLALGLPIFAQILAAGLIYAAIFALRLSRAGGRRPQVIDG